MRLAATAALMLFSLSTAAQAAPTACNVTVNVTDSDPAGLNVRSLPNGKVTATLKNTGDWIELHVVAMDGDWYRIDRATQIGDGDKQVFSGSGYVHKSTVGLSGLQQGAVLYLDHDEKSRAIVSSADGDQVTALLGCFDDFYKVRIKEGTGWTKTVCNNEFTTCS